MRGKTTRVQLPDHQDQFHTQRQRNEVFKNISYIYSPKNDGSLVCRIITLHVHGFELISRRNFYMIFGFLIEQRLFKDRICDCGILTGRTLTPHYIGGICWNYISC